jgi:hypothetical protein
MLDLLRQLIRQQQNQLGTPVLNLFGAVPSTAGLPATSVASSWSASQVVGNRLLDIDEFYAVYNTSQVRATELLAATNGTAVTSGLSAATGQASVFLFRSVVTTAGPTSVPLSVDAGAPAGEFAIYVDGVLLRRGVDRLTVTLTLGAGQHLLEVMGLGVVFGVQLPPSIYASGELDVLAEPQWSQITTGYVDAASGQLKVRLEWLNDPRVGAWAVHRRELTFLGTLTTVGALDPNGEFAVSLVGDYEAALTAGQDFVAGDETLGTILRGAYAPAASGLATAGTSTTLTDSNASFPTLTGGVVEIVSGTGAGQTRVVQSNTGTQLTVTPAWSVTPNTTSQYVVRLETVVQVRLADGLAEVDASWVGRPAAVGQWVEQARVTRTASTAAVSWEDTAVRRGTLYQYALQPFALANARLSGPWSQPQFVLPGDSTAPASIAVAGGYPQVFQGTVTVKFTPPSDEDYAGVRVFWFDRPVSGTATAGTTTSLTDATQNLGTTSYAGYQIYLTSGTGVDQTATVQSNTATVFTVTATTAFSPAPASGTGYEVYRLVPVLTDYGLPGVDDELTFTAVGEGTYYFLSFDRAGNMQGIWEGVSWVYSAANEHVIPVTNVLVTDRTQDGQVDPRIMGVTLEAVPPATDQVYDPFNEPDGTGFQLRDSGTSSASTSTNTTTKLEDTTKAWTVNGFAGKYLRVTQNGSNAGRVALVISNTATQLTLSPATPLPVAPVSSTYQILDHVPEKIAVSPGATGARWTTSDPTSVTIQQDAATFVGPKGGLYSMYLDGALASNFRVEAVLYRGGDGHFSGGVGYGSNLTYRGDATNAARWEVGVLHSSASLVTLRYRYLSGGAGTWTNVSTAYSWPELTGKKLIVELDGDVHTLKIADVYGHRELPVAAWSDARGNTSTNVGWALRGNPSGDQLDDFRVLTLGTLTRVRYHVSPDDDTLEVPWYTGTATSGSTRTLNDTTRLWRTDELVGKYVRILSGPGAGSDLRIERNSVDQLWPVTPFSAALTSSSTYLIYDRSYQGTQRVQFWRGRSPTQIQTLVFHGERAGVPPEVPQRLLIDPNAIPELTLTATKTAGGATNGEITVTVGPDDDVKRWALYARKGTYPTSTGAALADPNDLTQLDPSYLVWEGPISVTSRVLKVGNGTWYLYAVGYDSNVQPGPAVTAIVVVSSGGGGTTETLSNLTATRSGNAILLSWGHSAGLESPATTGTIRLYAYDSTRGKSGEQEITQFVPAISATQRYAWQDLSATSNTASNVGSQLDSDIVFGAKNVDPLITKYYRIELYVGGSLVNTYTTTYTTWGYVLA